MEGDKKINWVMTVGVFDCFHLGHWNLLKKMREQSESIIILIHDEWSTFENKGRVTIQNVHDRMLNVRMAIERLQFQHVRIAEVISSNPTEKIDDMLDMVLNEEGGTVTYMRGNDWQEFPGKQALERRGIEIKYVEYTKEISTTKIRETL